MINRSRLGMIIAAGLVGGLAMSLPGPHEEMRSLRPELEPERFPTPTAIKDHRRLASGKRDYGTKAERIRQGKW